MMSLADYGYDPAPFATGSDDDHDPGGGLKGIKRGTRACDRCRKLKSKCEPTDGDKCKNCTAAGTACTYQGPSFKRGPPKGYIHAIEQRWHQVECILGSVMAIPQAQNIISEIRNDPFANAILNRVDSGPYGPLGRAREANGSNNDFYATIMGAPESASRDDRRVRRQSRMTREIVSIENSSMLATPSKEWQDQLIRRLAGGQLPDYPIPSASASASPPSPSATGYRRREISESGEPGRQRRRLDGPNVHENIPTQSSWNEPYAGSDDSYSNWDEVDDAADSFGHLALDGHNEIRYHGHASGLPLLARSERVEGSQQVDGLWKFPALKQEELSEDFDVSASNAEDDPSIPLPPLEVQQHLVNLYFTYVHPVYPVVHKRHFLANFPMQARSESQVFGGQHESRNDRMPMQKISKLLLLAMFSIAARYADQRISQMIGQSASNAGVEYAMGARQILNNIYQFSRPSTVQTLLLLGIREFGIGSMEQGWLYSGMALRMAIDLGMNRNADKWTENEKEIFTPVEKQIRKQIWWTCCITDKLSAMWMGRPIMFRANDYSTLKPDAVEEDDYENWQPYPTDVLGPDFSPRPSMIMTCFREQCELSVIITDIMDQIYPVRTLNEKPRRQLMQQLEARLHNWLFSLPEHLRYSPASNTVTPLPHILIVHIEYCAAVLLLHRAFIPHANGGLNDSGIGASTSQGDTLPLKSFDICQSAAAHISSLVTVFHEKYGLQRAPSFLSIYLQSAGIMHVITLTRHPENTQATIGLKQCIDALHRMEGIWPSAMRVRNLLEGAKVKRDQTSLSMQNAPVRQKRSMEEALGSQSTPDFVEGPAYVRPAYSEPEVSQPGPAFDEDVNAPFTLQTLGLDVPGLEASTSYYPGYQWWPRGSFDDNLLQGGMMDMSAAGPSTSLGEGSFTFNPQQLAPGFVQGVHYPILDPSNIFPQDPNTTPHANGVHNPQANPPSNLGR